MRGDGGRRRPIVAQMRAGLKDLRGFPEFLSGVKSAHRQRSEGQ